MWLQTQCYKSWVKCYDFYLLFIGFFVPIRSQRTNHINRSQYYHMKYTTLLTRDYMYTIKIYSVSRKCSLLRICWTFKTFGMFVMGTFLGFLLRWTACLRRFLLLLVSREGTWTKYHKRSELCCCAKGCQYAVYTVHCKQKFDGNKQALYFQWSYDFIWFATRIATLCVHSSQAFSVWTDVFHTDTVRRLLYTFSYIYYYNVNLPGSSNYTFESPHKRSA